MRGGARPWTRDEAGAGGQCSSRGSEAQALEELTNTWGGQGESRRVRVMSNILPPTPGIASGCLSTLMSDRETHLKGEEIYINIEICGEIALT